MEFEKSSEEFKEFFASIAPTGPEIEHKKVFGYPACFINGNMFTGLHGRSMILRLDSEKRDEFARTHGAQVFEPMPGRPMKEYMVIPPAVLDDRALLATWLDASLTYARTIPAKSKKPKPASPRGSKK